LLETLFVFAHIGQKIDKHKPEGKKIIHITHTHTNVHTHTCMLSHMHALSHTLGQETKHVNNFHLAELPLEWSYWLFCIVWINKLVRVLPFFGGIILFVELKQNKTVMSKISAYSTYKCLDCNFSVKGYFCSLKKLIHECCCCGCSCCCWCYVRRLLLNE